MVVDEYMPHTSGDKPMAHKKNMTQWSNFSGTQKIKTT